MTSKISPALLEDVLWTFDTVAAMVAETKLVAGNRARTLGYFAPGDGGGWFYGIESAATAVDGIVDHTLANGRKAVLQHNGTFHAEWAGAVDGREQSGRLNAAWSHLRAWKTSTSGNPDVFFIHGASGTLLNQVQIASTTNGRITGVNIDFRNQVLTAVAGGNLSATIPMLMLRVKGDVYLGTLDGGKFAATYQFTGCAGARIYNPYGTHYKGFGAKVSGSCGSMMMYSALLEEYQPEDLEFILQSNYTAVGMDVETGDWNCFAPNVKWSKVPLRIGADCVGAHFIEPHLVNGNPKYEPGTEPIVILGMGQSNMVGNFSSTTGSHLINSGVYIWNGTSAVHGTAFAPAAFGTAPFNVGDPPYANNLMIHAANQLASATGREVYIIMVADGGRKIECFLTPETLADNGWTAVVNFTPYMYPDIREACLAVPGRNSSFPDAIMWQQGEANNMDSQAVYEAKLEALLSDLSANGVLYNGYTDVTLGGLVPVHAYYSTHRAACLAVEASRADVKYIATAALADTDGWHFTGESLVTLGTAHAAAWVQDSAPVEASGPAFVDTVLIENYARRTNHVHLPYLDNGYTKDFAGTLNIRGGHYVKNNRAILQHPFIRIYASSVNQKVPVGLNITDIGGKCSIGFLPFETFTWSGEWEHLADQYLTMDDDNRTAQWRLSEYNIYPDSSAKIQHNYKPAGKFRKEWQVKGSRMVENYDPLNGIYEIVGKGKFQTLRVTDLPTSSAGLSPGDLWRSGNDVKIAT